MKVAHRRTSLAIAAGIWLFLGVLVSKETDGFLIYPAPVPTWISRQLVSPTQTVLSIDSNARWKTMSRLVEMRMAKESAEHALEVETESGMKLNKGRVEVMIFFW